jgi:hypothetical protein
MIGRCELEVYVDGDWRLAAVARFATDPRGELKELILRDVLDVALGNTDNHGRNTAVSKHLDGRIELSPIFDFSPMVLDPQRKRKSPPSSWTRSSVESSASRAR